MAITIIIFVVYFFSLSLMLPSSFPSVPLRCAIFRRDQSKNYIKIYVFSSALFTQNWFFFFVHFVSTQIGLLMCVCAELESKAFDRWLEFIKKDITRWACQNLCVKKRKYFALHFVNANWNMYMRPRAPLPLPLLLLILLCKTHSEMY